MGRQNLMSIHQPAHYLAVCLKSFLSRLEGAALQAARISRLLIPPSLCS